MLKKTIEDVSFFFRKLARLCLFTVALAVSLFLSFLVLKALVHAVDYIQAYWEPILWIF